MSDILIRALGCLLSAFMLTVLLAPTFIRFLKRLHVGQVVRQEGPKTHYAKAGTPTMGGSLVLITITVSTLLWAHLQSISIWLTLWVMLSFGGIGFLDDFLKITKRNTKGLSGRRKLFFQTLIALCVIFYLYHTGYAMLWIPVWHVGFTLSLFFIIFACLVIVGSSNAVNLTDGLDGLAIFPVVVVSAALGVFAYHSHPVLSDANELVVLCSAMVGAGLGFLWFNATPAAVFMGDVGALGLGGALGTMAVILQQEIAFFIMSGVFVLEAISVMLQVSSYRLRKGKRIFRMAPLHHHFEMGGMAETKIVARFWIVTIVLVLIGLATQL